MRFHHFTKFMTKLLNEFWLSILRASRCCDLGILRKSRDFLGLITSNKKAEKIEECYIVDKTAGIWIIKWSLILEATRKNFSTFVMSHWSGKILECYFLSSAKRTRLKSNLTTYCAIISSLARSRTKIKESCSTMCFEGALAIIRPRPKNLSTFEVFSCLVRATTTLFCTQNNQTFHIEALRRIIKSKLVVCRNHGNGGWKVRSEANSLCSINPLVMSRL